MIYAQIGLFLSVPFLQNKYYGKRILRVSLRGGCAAKGEFLFATRYKQVFTGRVLRLF